MIDPKMIDRNGKVIVIDDTPKPDPIDISLSKRLAAGNYQSTIPVDKKKVVAEKVFKLKLKGKIPELEK